MEWEYNQEGGMYNIADHDERLLADELCTIKSA